MWKMVFRAVSLLLVVLVMVAVSACREAPEPEYAGAILENILQAMNEDDYAKYSEHFTEAMKSAEPEAIFRENTTVMKMEIGDYVGKEFWKVEKQYPFTIVYYRVKFTKAPENVTGKVVFQTIEGKIYVVGLELDSPKLRGR